MILKSQNMKKLSFLFALCMLGFLLPANAQKIGIDGFILGDSKSTSIFNVGKAKMTLKARGDDWLQYTGNGVYTLYFENDKLIKVTKLLAIHTDLDYIKTAIQKEYFELAYNYGEPTMSGNTFAIWREGNYKLTYDYPITSEQVETRGGSIFALTGPIVMVTYYKCNIFITLELIDPSLLTRNESTVQTQAPSQSQASNASNQTQASSQNIISTTAYSRETNGSVKKTPIKVEIKSMGVLQIISRYISNLEGSAAAWIDLTASHVIYKSSTVSPKDDLEKIYSYKTTIGLTTYYFSL